MLADLTVFIVQIQPVPFRMLVGVSSELIKLYLLFVVAALKESIEFLLAPTDSPHCLLFTALFQSGSCFPALSPSKLVSLHLYPILFNPSEDVQSPIVPHGRTCLYYIVWLRMKLRQVCNRTVLFLCGPIVPQILLLLSQHSRR